MTHAVLTLMHVSQLTTVLQDQLAGLTHRTMPVSLMDRGGPQLNARSFQ